MNVVIIGSGNVATVLGRLIKKAGHNIIQVYSRKLEHAQTLATELNSIAINAVAAIDNNATIYIIALSDTAITELSNELQLKDKLVVHTAGAVSKSILKNISSRYGVLYPYQTLRKEISVPNQIPLLIDGDTEATINAIQDFAKTISPIVYEVSDEQRSKLHLAAVVVNNFTNHLFTLASDYCKEEGIDFTLLLPIIEETFQRIKKYEPREVQTGPAIRNDKVTLNIHLQLLEKHPHLKNIYIKMTESIAGS